MTDRPKSKRESDVGFSGGRSADTELSVHVDISDKDFDTSKSPPTPTAARRKSAQELNLNSPTSTVPQTTTPLAVAVPTSGAGNIGTNPSLNGHGNAANIPSAPNAQTPAPTVDDILRQSANETTNVNAATGSTGTGPGTGNAVVFDFDDDGEADVGPAALAGAAKQSNFSTYCFVVLEYIQKFFFLLCSLVLAAAGAFVEYDFREEQFTGVPIWRLLFYFASLYPALLFGKLVLELFLLALRITSLFDVFRRKNLQSGKTISGGIGFDIIKDFDKLDNRKTGFHDVILFFRRYYANAVYFLWAILVTVAWGVAMSPRLWKNSNVKNISAKSNKSDFIFENFDSSYDTIVRLHVILCVYFLGGLFVHFIVFKYLYQFSFKHYMEKTYASLFSQTVLLGLCGLKGSRGSSATYFLPNELYQSNTTFDEKSQHRLEHAAARYVLGNKLEKIFAYNLGLKSDENAFVVDQTYKTIRNSIKRQVETNPTLNDAAVESKRRGVVTSAVIEMILSATYGKDINIEAAMKLFDEQKTNLVSVKAIKGVIEKAFSDRDNLMLMLKDSEAITAQIRAMLKNMVNVLVLFIGLIIFGINVLEAWLSFSTIILGFSFVFGKTFSTFFENIVFLYASHPYDVGDTIRLGPEKSIFVVKRVLLQTTELVSLANEVRTIQNSVIAATEPLFNISQSKGYWQESYFVVDADIINQQLLDNLNADMDAFLKKRPDIYQGYFRIDYCDFQPPMKVKLQLGISLCINCASPGVCRTAQSKACLQFVESLSKYGGAKYTALVEYAGEMPAAN